MKTENKITKERNILLVLHDAVCKQDELEFLVQNFCGKVTNDLRDVKKDQIKVYVCGDLSNYNNEGREVFVIRELSHNYELSDKENMNLINLGEVPVIINDVGVFYREFFEEDDYFNKIRDQHKFQNLTESTKQSNALRKGIYMTEVSKERKEDKSELLHFRLLRCSSNFTGPTDNLRKTDHYILKKVNNAIKSVFEKDTELNHVLAQIYENKKRTDGSSKEVKAKIKAHSDKTKDMAKDGLIAFITFYDKSNVEHLKQSTNDKFDLCYKATSGLTRLHFKLKSTVNSEILVKQFSITLYPNSVFLIPLSTNRLYTHEIKPSVLNIDRIPIRMGYVARCSNLKAIYMNGQTYIDDNNELVKLEPMTQETMDDLRATYYDENRTEKIIEYGKVHFSMNSGDYEEPIY